MNAALNLEPPALTLIQGGALARAQAVAKFRELADRLESGELRGARVCWRDGRSYIEVVEVDAFDLPNPGVRLNRIEV